MAPQGWTLLSQEEEDALHNVSRLLNIEWRPFQRISSRVIKPGAIDNLRFVQLPSPPPDASAADEAAAALAAQRGKQEREFTVWRSDIVNELELLEYAILRQEYTTKSNVKERDRYAIEKTAILNKQQHVKEDIEGLRGTLEQARETLAVRKTYDELTEKITNSKMLKSREEQANAHQKLDEEIAELEAEVQVFKDTWHDRAVQFGRIEQEAREMLRMIKDEKEEAERKEGMMKDENDDVDGEGSTTRGDASHVGTPRPDGSQTPLHVSQQGEVGGQLKVPQDRLAPVSRENSTALSVRSGLNGDTDMVDSGAVSQNGHADNDSSGIESGEEEEGEEREEGEEGEAEDD
ncbi:hypothetical protein BS50DRAFT_550495 [Corynespora cassiicola Philippines]|uniref:Tho complex subunit 7 mft1p n=1 Tax=Corynespora cassiicola Philippines TaxID=1448308 RepID=A0A2T2NQ72_CORCC|nr:hypothetical protein BS50DRAFT_550495 [Corynespora cassiicola Philippines]